MFVVFLCYNACPSIIFLFKNMKVAFYKGKTRLFNKLVRWWTRGPYSHVEIVFSDGLSYSSSYIDGGVRSKRIRFDERLWDFVQLDDQLDESTIRMRAEKMIGSGFDVMGLFGFIMRRVSHSKNRLFCSEFVMRCLGYSDPWRFDPNTAYSVILRARQ